MTQLEPASCRLCGRPLEHHGTVCNRCWKVRRNNTPQANAAADLDAHWMTRPLGEWKPQKMADTRNPEWAGPSLLEVA